MNLPVNYKETTILKGAHGGAREKLLRERLYWIEDAGELLRERSASTLLCEMNLPSLLLRESH